MHRATRSKTPAFCALGFSFGVRSNDARLDRYIEALFAPFHFDGKAEHHYTIRGVGGEPPRTHELALDRRPVTTAGSAEGLIGPLVHSVNREMISTAPFLLLHAGGVERGGCGIVLPGHMEAGKTTLVAALVRAGFGYLTDEAVAFGWDDHVIEPYPKPMSIDPGAWGLFPELEPDLDLATDGHKATQWQLPPSDIRSDAVGTRCAARFVVFPRYKADVETKLESVSRATALIELAKNTFAFKDQSRRALETLDAIVREVECFRLSMGDLDAACELVSGLSARS